MSMEGRHRLWRGPTGPTLLALLVCSVVLQLGEAANVAHLRRIQRKGVVVADATVQDGDAVPISTTTLIAGESDMASSAAGSGTSWDTAGSVTFGDDLRNDDNQRQTMRAAPLTEEDPSTPRNAMAAHSVAGGDAGDAGEVRWGDPESFGRHAINRVAKGIPELLKEVDRAKALYNHRAFSDYYDVPAIRRAVQGTGNEEDAIALLELQADTEDLSEFLDMNDEERVNELQRKKRGLQRLRDSIQLELAATARMQDRVKSSTTDAVVHRSAAPRLDEELKASDELAELNPQLKEWAAESHFHQNKREINSLLDETTRFLEGFQMRLAREY